MIFAHGSRFGGHALFNKEHKLHYVYNFLGITPEQKFVSSVDLKPGKYTLSGDGLCVGFDSGDAVSGEYKTPGAFHGGEIRGVEISVGTVACADLEREAQMAMARDQALIPPWHFAFTKCQGVGAATARRLEGALGASAEMWLGMQARFQIMLLLGSGGRR